MTIPKVAFLPGPVYKLLKALPSAYLRGIFEADPSMCTVRLPLLPLSHPQHMRLSG